MSLTAQTRVAVAGLGTVTIRALSPSQVADLAALSSKELAAAETLRLGLVEPSLEALTLPPLADPAAALAELALVIASFSKEGARS